MRLVFYGPYGQPTTGGFMQAGEIHDMIKAGLPDAEVDVRGEDGTHFEAIIVSPSFSGKRTLERHRLVYATLGDRMGGEIHALSMQTLTPEESRG